MPVSDDDEMEKVVIEGKDTLPPTLFCSSPQPLNLEKRKRLCLPGEKSDLYTDLTLEPSYPMPVRTFMPPPPYDIILQKKEDLPPPWLVVVV